MTDRRGRATAVVLPAALLSALATLAVLASSCLGPPAESLTVVSWGGSLRAGRH